MALKDTFVIKEAIDPSDYDDGVDPSDYEDGLGEDDVFAGKRLPTADESELQGVSPADAIKNFMDSFEQNQFGDSIWQSNMRTVREQVIAVAVACLHLSGD